MNFRTDLAVEIDNIEKESIFSREKIGQADIIYTEINENNIFLKPAGKYVTVEFNDLAEIVDFSDIDKALKKGLSYLLPEKRENILVVGLGNSEITSDSIGPATAQKILATRHIAGEFAKTIGLENLRAVSVVSPNVLGKTGIEVSEIILGVVNRIKPDAVIVIDALCSKSISRLFNTIQMCDSGISPGSGVKNSRKEISRKTLGVPVVAVGVPTVVDAETIAYELTGNESQTKSNLIVTPKDADLLCHRISEVLAAALNVFLQPQIDESVILSLV